MPRQPNHQPRSQQSPEPKIAPRSPRSRPAKRNRGALPAHLSRIEVIVDVEDTACPCCGGTTATAGEDVAEMLDYAPAQVRVKVIRRPRRGCRACEGAVVQAPAPDRGRSMAAWRPRRCWCAHPDQQIRRLSAVVSPGPDPRPSRCDAGSFHPVRLGRPSLLVARPHCTS